MRRFVIALMCVLSLSLLPHSAAACGGLFCTNTPVDQAAERIIFAVDSTKGEVTAYVQINYTGSSDAFSWVVPVPNNPQVDVAEMDSFDELSQLTTPRVIFPSPPECFQMPMLDAAAPAASGGSVDVFQQGSVGPYDFSVIGGEDSAELVDWLRTNGYRITPDMEPLVKVYTDENMLFLAMKLSSGEGVQDIQPVVMTYKATKPMIPIRLTAVAANPNMAIITWIFADTQARPANLSRLVMRENDLAVTDMFGNNNYTTLRSGALDAWNGKAFFTEYAQPTSAIQSSDPLIQQLASTYPYLTRLYGEMSPDEMTIDPVFEFNSELPDKSNVIDLSDRYNPYDCTTNDVLTVNQQQQLAARVTVSEEVATADLRRGPLRILSLIAVVGLLGIIVWQIRRKPRTS